MGCLVVFLDRLWEVAKQLPLWVFGKRGYVTPPKRDEDVQACWTNRGVHQCGRSWSLPDQAPEYMPGGKVFVNHSLPPAGSAQTNPFIGHCVSIQETKLIKDDEGLASTPPLTVSMLDITNQPQISSSVSPTLNSFYKTA